MRRVAFALVLLAASLAAASCNQGFRPIDGGAPDGSDARDGRADGDGAVPDGIDAAPDAAPDGNSEPPADFVCAEPWTKATKSDSTCQPRKVFVIESSLTSVPGVSVTRAPSGVLAVAYEKRLGLEESRLHVARFAAGSAAAGKPGSAKIIEVEPPGRFERLGAASDVIAASSGDLHVAYLLLSNFGNEVGYTRIPATVDAPLPVETVATGLPSAVAPVGIGLWGTPPQPHVIYYQAQTGDLRARLRGSSGWLTDRLIQAGGDSASPGAGQNDVVSTSTGVHVAFQYGLTFALSHPRYAAQAGPGAWPIPTTLDNNAPTTLVGWSIDLAVRGTDRWAVYYERNQSTGAALRLASWSGTQKPTISIRDQGIDDSSATPRFCAAIDVDRFGLLHIVAARPSVGGTRIEYMRQSGTAGQWLSETIAEDVDDGQVPAQVDIVVDDAARPHIVYYNSKTISVSYATRYDR